MGGGLGLTFRGFPTSPHIPPHPSLGIIPFSPHPLLQQVQPTTCLTWTTLPLPGPQCPRLEPAACPLIPFLAAPHGSHCSSIHRTVLQRWPPPARACSSGLSSGHSLSHGCKRRTFSQSPDLAGGSLLEAVVSLWPFTNLIPP